MTDFDLSGLRPPQPDPPPPPIDPAAARQQRIVDDTRVAEAVTRFIADKQDALFNQPDAFYRTQGADAIHAAPVITKRLLDMKDAALDGADNDYQRRKLGAALDAHMVLTRGDIARHVANQSLEWQRQTALDRIDLLAKEVALHHTYSDDTIGVISEAAANAARAHVRVGDTPPAPEAEDQAAATARRRVLSSAIQARLDAGNVDGAARLYGKAQTQLGEGQAKLLDDQIQTAQRQTAARTYSVQIAPVGPLTFHEEADGWHADATAQNQRDHADDPERQAAVQQQLDADHVQAKQAIDERQVALDKAVADWIATPRAEGTPQVDRPSPALWDRLDEARQAAVLGALRRNQRPSLDKPTAEQASASTITAIQMATAAGTSIMGTPTMTAPPLAGAGELAALAARLVPLAGAGAGAAAATLLIPTNTQSNTISLGDGLQARWSPDSRTATIERRVDNGLLGTGLGAKWEVLPVAATYDSGPDGRKTLQFDPLTLKQALPAPTTGEVAGTPNAVGSFQALPMAKPVSIKASIAKEINGVTTFEEATDEETEKYCGSYLKLLEIGTNAAEIARRTTELLDGHVFGSLVHKLANDEITRLLLEGSLKREGVFELHPEIALMLGERVSMWRAKGKSFPDVTEIYDREKACVYDFKTGTGKATKEDMKRYIEEVREFANKYDRGSYTHIYFITVKIPDAHRS